MLPVLFCGSAVRADIEPDAAGRSALAFIPGEIVRTYPDRIGNRRFHIVEIRMADGTLADVKIDPDDGNFSGYRIASLGNGKPPPAPVSEENAQAVALVYIDEQIKSISPAQIRQTEYTLQNNMLVYNISAYKNFKTYVITIDAVSGKIQSMREKT